MNELVYTVTAGSEILMVTLSLDRAIDFISSAAHVDKESVRKRFEGGIAYVESKNDLDSYRRLYTLEEHELHR